MFDYVWAETAARYHERVAHDFQAGQDSNETLIIGGVMAAGIATLAAGLPGLLAIGVIALGVAVFRSGRAVDAREQQAAEAARRNEKEVPSWTSAFISR